MPRPRRLLTLLALALVAAALVACGSKGEEGRVARADTEGIYLDIGGLKYQVQVSRQLNPDDTEDRGFLTGIPGQAQGLKPDETYFGVFLLVQNEQERALASSGDFEITDTQGDTYRPLDLRPTNVFAYGQTRIPPGGQIPAINSPAAETPVQGSVLVFKLPNDALGNRPLELKIESAEVPQETGIVNLDI